RAALVSHDPGGALGDHVDDLPFSFIAPLGANDTQRPHFGVEYDPGLETTRHFRLTDSAVRRPSGPVHDRGHHHAAHLANFLRTTARVNRRTVWCGTALRLVGGDSGIPLGAVGVGLENRLNAQEHGYDTRIARLLGAG